MNQKHVFLTGATGYIGRHVLFQLLKRGFRVTALVRRKKENVRDRLIDVLSPLGPLPAEGSLQVLEGDLVLENLGISTEEMGRLNNRVDAFLHCAGLTRFERERSEEIFLHNVRGTRNGYGVCKTLGIRDFHYVSTAYVAGDYLGDFSGDCLEVGQKFRNPYEESKFEAERFLKKMSENFLPVVTTYRPSIVVGGHVGGENLQSSPLYAYLKVFYFLRECCRRDQDRGGRLFGKLGVARSGDGIVMPIRIGADPDVRLNLVSVHEVADAIIKTLTTRPGTHSVLDLLGGEEFTLDRIRTAFCEVLGLRGPRLVPAGEFFSRPRNTLERRFYRATRVYEPYLFSSPRFRFRKGPNAEDGGSPPVDVRKLARDFLEEMEGRDRRTDGARLNKLALDCLGVDDPLAYFEKFRIGELGTSFLRRNRFVNARIRFRVSGTPPFDRTLCIESGEAHYPPDKNPPEEDCRFEMNPETFRSIIRGDLEPKEAFFRGSLKIFGNKEIALKFGYLLGLHFRNGDDRVLEELTEEQE